MVRRLKKLGLEHAQRDATTMLWQSQMKMLEDYIPDSKLEDDIILHKSDLIICVQEISPKDVYNPRTSDMLYQSGVSGQTSGVFKEHIHLKRLAIQTYMDMQHH